MQTSAETLAELRQLEALFTLGAWTAKVGWDAQTQNDRVDVYERTASVAQTITVQYATFIAAMRNALPGLLADHVTMEARIEELEAALAVAGDGLGVTVMPTLPVAGANATPPASAPVGAGDPLPTVEEGATCRTALGLAPDLMGAIYDYGAAYYRQGWDDDETGDAARDAERRIEAEVRRLAARPPLPTREELARAMYTAVNLREPEVVYPLADAVLALFGTPQEGA